MPPQPPAHPMGAEPAAAQTTNMALRAAFDLEGFLHT
jgi:hypothetical protein